MRVCVWLMSLALFLAWTALPHGGGARAADVPEGLSVLMISSFHQDLPFAKRIENGLDQALKHRSGRNAVYVEYLDAARFEVADYGAAYARMLEVKLRGKTFDAVIVWGGAATRFLLANWDVIRPLRVVGIELTQSAFAPVVAKGAPARMVTSEDETGASIETALRASGAKRLVLLGDSSRETGRIRLSNFLKAWRYPAADVTLENLFNTPLDQLVERLKTLPKDAVVYYTPLFTDENGRNITPTVALSRVVAASSAPVFSQWDTFVGDRGAVGGWLLSGEALGRTAGLLVAAMAAGEGAKVDELASATQHRMIFDAEQMARWGVTQSQLPPGAAVINAPDSVWDSHREFVIVVAVALTVLALCSVILWRLLAARRRLTAELALERENLARKVVERTLDLDHKADELARSNAELESFAYAVSHDLRAPLRAVNSYLALLLASAKEKFDDEEREYVGFARSGAARLDGMIHGLLEYSRVGRRDKATASVRLQDAVGEALESLNAPTLEPNATIKMDLAADLPPVAADMMCAERLVQNLVDNALKYRHPSRAPEITLSAEIVGDEVILTVADNGVGIPENQRERVFALFQRISTHTEGYGVGLALCRRIMDACGGRLWVDSAPGEGSAFHAAFQISRAA